MPPFWLMPGMPGNPISNDSDGFCSSKDYTLDEMSIRNATIKNDPKHRTVREYLDDHDETSGMIVSDDDFSAGIGNTVYIYSNGMKIEADKDSAFIDFVKMVQKPYV